MKQTLTHISRNALWHNNTGLVQLMGLCPLLAVTTTMTNGIGLGVATIIVISLSNIFASLSRPILRPETRIAVFLFFIAAVVTVVDLCMQAWFYDLHRTLGIFVPLIVTNCAIVSRAETFASHTDPVRAGLDGLMTGIGFATVLILIGAIRELIGRGTLFADADMLFGVKGAGLTIELIDGGFLIAVLAPGAFITLGLLIALRNVIAGRQTAHELKPAIME